MKIKINNFFDIVESDLDIKPIMVICGDNGTGKTHLIKLISTIREFLMKGNLFKLNDEELKEIQKILDFTSIKENLLIKKNSEIQFSGECLDCLYEYLEKIINKNLKDQLELIWKTTFGKSSSKNTIGNVSIEFTNKVPKLNLLIDLDSLREDSDLFINEFNEIKLPNKDVFNEFIMKLAELNEKMNFLKLTYSVKTLEYDSYRGLSLFGENLTIEGKFDQIVEAAIENIFEHLCKVELNLKDNRSELYYLPASREAYHRDLEVFRKKLKEDNNVLVSKYIVDKKGRKKSTFSSKDPFIENYIENITDILTKDDLEIESEQLKKLLLFFEKEILQAEILVDSSSLKYKLMDNQIITPNMASSLQNEYAFLKVLIERVNKSSITIEEPESHLSIKNATKLIYFLLSYQYLSNNHLWITTHNNFISDAINNFIMISKLKVEDQKRFLGLIGLDDILMEIDKNMDDRIGAYLINESKINKLPKNEYGINFENFTNQITDLINISLDLQVAMDNMNE